MRLTNYIRDAYIRSVMQDVPKKEFDEEIRSLVSKDLISQLPIEIKTIWEANKLRGWLEPSTAYFGESSIGVTYPCDRSDRWNRPAPKLTPAGKKAFDKLDSEYVQQKKTLKELEDKVKGAAYGCKTREQLAKLIPEFEKYLPEDEPAAIKTLPIVANTMSDFVKAGWPKDKKAKGTK